MMQRCSTARCVLVLGGGVVLGAGVVPSTAAAAGSTEPVIVEYPVENAAELLGITAGPDGNVWFTESNLNVISRITPGGAVTEFPLPSAQYVSTSGQFAANTRVGPEGITLGPDHNIWFTENGYVYGRGGVGRVTPAGDVTEYQLTSGITNSVAITTGRDGALWFTEPYTNRIGRITTDGAVSYYPIPLTASGLVTPGVVPAEPQDITTGPDGALWFVDGWGGHVVRLTTDGTFTYYTPPGGSQELLCITPGPNGDLWFPGGANGSYYMGRITVDGQITEHPAPSGANCAVMGPDHALWYGNGNAVARMDIGGNISEYPIPASYGGPGQTRAWPRAITVGPDHNLWFTDYSRNMIGHVILPADMQAPPHLAYGHAITAAHAGTIATPDADRRCPRTGAWHSAW